MKGNKLLAGILSATMVLGTMVMPAFAEGSVAAVGTSDDFINAISADNTATTIKLTNNITLNVPDTDPYSPTQRKISKDCTIDLGEYTLDKGNCNFLYTSNNVKFTGVKGSAKMTWTSISDSFVKGYANSVLTFENIEFSGSASDCYIVSVEGSNPAMSINNCTMENITAGYAPIASNGTDSYININDSKISVADSTKKVLQNGNYVISGNSEITGKVFSNGEVYKIGNNVSIEYSNVKTTVATVTSSNGVVKAFDDFTAALTAATADDTIKLYDDVEYSKHVSGANRVTKAKALDLNGKTLSLPDDDYNFGEITISNGTIESTKTTMSQTTALIFQYDQDPITFDGVTINTKDFSTYGYVIGTNGGECVFKNSKMNVNPTTQTDIASLFSPGDDTSTCNLVIENSEINVSNASTKIALWGNVEIKGSSKINADLTDNDGIRLNDHGSLKIVATTDSQGNTKAPEINITVSGSNRYGINLGANTTYTKDETATVNATVYKKVAQTNVADKLTVKFVPTAEANVYDIVVVPTENTTKVINRLSAAEFDFVLTTTYDMSFEIAGANNVNVNRDDKDHVLFNFDGVNEVDASGVEVKLGTVTINGYGRFTFGIDANGNNKVQTAEFNNNIVNTIEADKLIVTNKIDNVELKAPTCDLTVKIDFNNTVNAQGADYTDMTVKVSGHDFEKIEKLANITNSKAEVKFEDILEKDRAYTVEVSGAGYRTARYTVTMTNDKTLNFWNNVKDSAANVEENNTASAKTTTFLAGELVNDGKINIYDLSAVVSYFGTTNDVSAASQYAKYDLNRDGKIDSRDIAYVLVSWGK